MPDLRPRTPPAHWPVVAWLRLKLPPAPPPMTLAGNLPPPPEPPLDFLVRHPVSTDPRKALYGFEEFKGEGLLVIYWDADEPEVLAAEYRLPEYRGRIPPSAVREFWGWVKERIVSLGPLPVLGADPKP